MNKIRVLVAEDDEVNAKAARTMLEQLGCSVDVATNGTEAVDHFRERDYDLILMDWQMPLMNGIEATARIRSMPGGIGTPIVGTTAGKAHEAQLFVLFPEPIRCRLGKVAEPRLAFAKRQPRVLGLDVLAVLIERE